MTRRDRTQPGSLAEHAVTGVRYCGGCNPRYDRTALVGRLAERCPNVRFVRAEAGREYDALLVVGGCCACSKGGTCVTSGCSIEYLRPANGSKIYCTATPKKLGRTLSVVALEMTNDQGAVVATATYTFFMMH